MPGKRYFVTGYSCECRGFIVHQRCKHYAALLSALGWLPGSPDADPGMVITCAHIDGHYSLEVDPEWQGRVPRSWSMASRRCRSRVMPMG